MRWYADNITFDVWDGQRWGLQQQIYRRPMQQGIERTDIFVFDNKMKVRHFGVDHLYSQDHLFI